MKETAIYLFACSWISRQRGAFTAEDLKKAYYDAGNPIPAHLNHFGLAFMRLSRECMIRKIDFVPSKGMLSHGRHIFKWVYVEASRRQRLNRTTNGRTQVSLGI